MDPGVFARSAKSAGVDGVLILDYPVEEAEPLRAPLVNAGIDPIFLISPTTTDERIRMSGELGRGFLYLISRMGVTGVRDDLAADVTGLIARVRAQSKLPVALGFGISSPEHVATVCKSADAAVVGSALVQVIGDHGAAPDVAHRAGEYVRWLKSAL
jgi:tryptophan synthase alpha chain